MKKNSIFSVLGGVFRGFAGRSALRSEAVGSVSSGPSAKSRIISLVALLLMAVTQGAWAQYNVTKDATMSEGWTITPDNPVTTGATITATYSGSRHVKSVKYVKKAPVVTTVDLSTLSANYEAQNGDVLTGTLGGNYKITIADEATVTLDGLTVNGVDNSDYNWAGITCEGDATIILKGTNTVKGFYQNYPGIFVPEGKTLTIRGDGSLSASPFDGGAGGSYGAGIGGGYYIACGNIRIESGNINAKGGNDAAGIGGGYDASCGNITITGGTINATSGYEAAGIGSGRNGSCADITITGGTTVATGGNSGAGIGGGYGASCGTITITDGVTSVTATAGSGTPKSIGTGDGSAAKCGTITIGGTTYPDGITTSPYTYAPSAPVDPSAPVVKAVDLSTLSADYEAQDGDVLTGTLAGNYKISIADGATVTLDGAAINGVKNESYRWAGITLAGDATIILSGTNTVKGFYEDYPGIYVPSGKTVTIQGDGSLNASSNGWGAGIGAGFDISCGNIEIQGGIITATGGQDAAGIGGSAGMESATSCGYITISGGTITATGGQDGAGIGSGANSYNKNSSCGNITISGGNVTAAGNGKAAGIGGSFASSCGDITIANTVTKVTATKGDNASNSIGKGNSTSATCGTVTIGGTVYPDGISGSPYTYDPSAPVVTTVDLSALTGNYEAQNGETLTGTLAGNYKISIADGATVTLDGVNITNLGNGCDWAGINCPGNATLVLEGSNTVCAGLDGSGYNNNYPGIWIAPEKTLTIQGDGSLTAYSNETNPYGAGIGGGFNIACGNIRIEGGTITATGGDQAAGIGSGGIGSCGNITITGGTITATGGDYAAGIGSGFKGSCGDITIANTVTKVTATKGEDTNDSIGAGEYGSCGTVTIGGTVYPDGISESPYTYQP